MLEINPSMELVGSEFFNVTPRQMQSYKANAIMICKRFIGLSIMKWLRD